MLKKVVELYKIPLLIAVFVTIAYLARTLQSDPLQIALILLGALAGTFFLDLDYFLHAYFLEPESDFGKSVQGFVHHKDFKGLANYIFYHKNDLKERTLNSALFQVVLGGASVLVVSSTAGNFVRAFVISAYINSMYRFAEQYFERKEISEWFWALKTIPNRSGLVVYSAILFAALLLTFSLLG